MLKVRLDVKDQKILAELDKNCRQSDAKIAKKVWMSQQVVSYRINRLMKSGVIRQFYAVIDVTKIGYSLYKAYFKLQNITKEKEDEIKQFLISHNNVLWAGACGGAWDLSVTILAKNAAELDKILKGFISRFNTNILYKTVILVVEAPHFLKSDKEDAKVLSFGGDNEKAELDDIDKRILSILSLNARMPYIELSESAKITLDIARYRVRRLIDSGIIKGFRVWINQDVIGKQFYKLLLSLQNATPEREKTLLGFCKRSANIGYALKTIGAWDIEFEYYVDDNKELHESIVHLRNSFQDIIRSYEPLLIFDEYKFNYWPFAQASPVRSKSSE